MKTQITKTETRKASKANGKAKREKASLKRTKGKEAKAKGKARKANGKARKASKATRKGGGKALNDFANDSKIKVLLPKEIPTRAGCFKTGITVSACLANQKAKGFRGRRKFIRAQIAADRVSLR